MISSLHIIQLQYILIHLSGEAGIGKTTFAHILAIEWATRKRKELDKFDLVFVIPLRDVKPHHRIEDLVIMCHRGLKAKKVTTKEIQQLLNDDEENKVLIVMDGYDEYTPGNRKLVKCEIAVINSVILLS